MPHLKKAIELDRVYVIKATSDKDFVLHEKKINNLISTLHHQARGRVEKALLELDKNRTELRTLSLQRSSFESKFACYMKLFDDEIEKVKTIAKGNTYFGYLDSILLIDRIRTVFELGADQFRRFVQSYERDNRIKKQRQKTTTLAQLFANSYQTPLKRAFFNF